MTDVASAATSANGIFIGMTWVPVFTVSQLPAGITAGAIAFASNGRAFAVTTLGALGLQAAGAGTGVLVTSNGTLWQIAGTTTTVSA